MRPRSLDSSSRRGRRAAAHISETHQAPPLPWTEDYAETHRLFVGDLLADGDVLNLFRQRRRLPRGFGVGFDERVIEYPWLFSHGLSGRTLDAGSTLNHPHILERVLRLAGPLYIATLAPEPDAYPDRGVSYIFGDLRDLPLRDRWFDNVVCLSTLEHVGMDNQRYGSAEPRAVDPAHEALLAARELRRVIRPGGRIFVTVPYGVREDHGGFRQLDGEDVCRLVEAFDPADAECEVFRYQAAGWQRSSLRGAARERYRDFVADPRPVPDRAPAARAVVCLAILV